MTIAAAEELLGRQVTDDVIDWVGIFEKAQARLNLSGSGQRSGTLLLRDWYPLARTLWLDSHVELAGDYRAKHHLGSSCGFTCHEDFEGDFVLAWKKPKPNSNHSNFGAGCRNLHVQTSAGLGGVSFRGAQQSAGIDNLVVRGFGEQGTGLEIGGDTYSIRDVFLDAAIGGGGSFTRLGATGLKTSGRTQGIVIENLTVHNSATGIRLGDAVEMSIQGLETELTELPVLINYNAMGVTIRQGQFRHTANIMDIEGARWPNDFLVKIDGMMLDHMRGRVALPGAVWETPYKIFDLAIQGTGRGISVIDLKARRQASA